MWSLILTLYIVHDNNHNGVNGKYTVKSTSAAAEIRELSNFSGLESCNIAGNAWIATLKDPNVHKSFICVRK